MAIAIVPQLPSAASAENQEGALNKTSYDFRATVKNIGMNEMGRALPVSELFMNSRNFSFGPKTRKPVSAPLTTIEVLSRGVQKVRKAAVRANRSRRSVTTKSVTVGHPSCDLASRKRAFMPS
ncbi:hypothetical protein GOD44_20350 [Sinorhizobium medicae]|nr:hypothetical protein [Sinorhizobium medicae]